MKRPLSRVRLVPALAALTLSAGTAAAQAVITATKDDGLAPGARRQPGEFIDYTITVKNTGTAAATSVTLTDPTPAGTTMVAGSLHASPVAIDDAYTAVGNTKLYVGVTPPAGEPAVAVSGPLLGANDAQVTAPDGFSVLVATVTTALGGTAQLNADGSFVYTPPLGSVAQDSFDYTLLNSVVPTLTGTGKAVITFNGRVWYVNGAVAGGNGSSTAPLAALTTLNGAGGAGDVDAAGDVIYVYKHTSAYTGGLRLENTQTLQGEAADLVVGGFTLRAAVPANVPTFSATTGSTLVLASGNTVRGLAFTNSAGKGISGAAIGTTVIDSVAVTTTGGTGIEATTSGTLSITGTANTIATTNGTGLFVQNVAIAAAGLNFRSIGSTGGATGITLQNTGTTGGLTVTGDGANTARGGNASGGTISGAVGADGTTADDGASNGAGIGVFAQNAGKIVLRRMTIRDCQNFAVEGESVTDLTLQYTTLNGTNGTSVTAQEGSVRLLEPRGTITLDNLEVTGGFAHNIRLDTSAGVINDFVVSNSQIHDGGAAGEDGILLDVEGSAVVTSHFTGNAFFNHFGDHVQISCLGTGTISSAIENNQFTGTRTADLGGGINISASAFDGTLRYKVTGNTLRGTHQGGAILASKLAGAATVDGTITNNIIGVSGSTGSGATLSSGIRVQQQGNGTHTVLLDGNKVRQYGQNGIEFSVGGTGANGALNATVTGNTVKEPASAANGGSPGVFFNFGTVTGNTNAVKLDFSGNDIVGAGTNDALGNEDFRIRQRFSTNVALKGYTGGASDAAAVLSYLQGQNPGAETGTATTQSPGVYANTATVPQPAFPLMLAPVEVAPVAATDAPVVPAVIETPAPAETKPLLGSEQLSLAVDQARALWTESGLDAAQTTRLHAVEFAIADLPERYLGRVDGLRVELDRDAGGYGWSFADDSVAEGRIDLVTAVAHEIGHALGLGDTYAAGTSADVMHGFLTPGQRRLPALGQALGAVPHEPGDMHFLDAPLSIGTLPPGDTVTVVYRVQVNAGLLTPSVSNQGTVTATGLAAVLTDDPTVAGAANPTVTVIEVRPILSDIAKTGGEDSVFTFALADFAPAFSDANGDALASIQITTLPTHGTLAVNGNAVVVPQTVTAAQLPQLTYTPASNYNGPDSFGWNASDGTWSALVAAAVNLTVTPVNDPPVAVGDTITRYPTQSVKVAKATLLANDTDVDHDTLTITSLSGTSANGGTVTTDATTVYYKPAAGFTGADSFTYTISDGQGGTAVGTVTVALANDATAGQNQTKIETLPNGAKRVTFAGIPGRTYRVQSTDSLAPAAWTDRASVTADSTGAISFTDAPPLPSQRYYRTVNP